MFRQPLSYLLLAILFLNYAVLLVNTDTLLSETKESEYEELGYGREDVQENKKIGYKAQKTSPSEVLRPPTKERPLKGHAPPSTPPTGYVEDYVDSVTDYNDPQDIGTIDDWTKMQARDSIYSALLEAEVQGGSSPTSLYAPTAYEANSGWANPTAPYTDGSDNAYTTSGGTIVYYNFNIQDLTGSTITGVEVQAQAAYYGGGGTLGFALRWNGRASETDSQTQTITTASKSLYTYGGSTDTWGRTWAATDFTNANFGIRMMATGKIMVYFLQVRVFHTIGIYQFDREFSFNVPPLFDEAQELCIRTGQIPSETLHVDIWNISSTNWTTITNISDSDDDTWKNISLSSYMTDTTFNFRFKDSSTTSDGTGNTWQIDAVLIKYKLLSAHFLYRKNITLDHTQVAATLDDFPVLIDLEDAGLHDHAQPNGADILFAQPSGMKLAHELDTFNSTYNSTHAHLVAWVKVPSLSSTTDTVISMYYGNRTTISNPEHPEYTWANRARAVWHLNETVTDEAFTVNAHNDSASNTYHLNQDGNDDIAGLIGKGQDFDGIDDLLNLTADKSLDPKNVTLSGWFKLDTTHSSGSTTSLLIMEKYLSLDDNMHVLLVGTDYTKAEVSAGALVFKLETAQDEMYKWTRRTTWAAGTWYYFACVLDADNPVNNKIYINGVDDTNSTYAGSATSLNLAYKADWGMGGGLIDTGNLPAGEAWFTGVLDELRVARDVRAAAWIATEYNNQKNPTNFYFLGLEEHMEDLDPPEIVAFGVTDPGNGHPEFWANLTDDFSGVASVNITLNGTIYPMNFNSSSGLWTYQQSVNFTDYWTYQISNASDYASPKHFLPVSSAIKNVTFDYDAVAPSINEWVYFPDLGPNGTFNANVSEWGVGIDVVIVNITKVNEAPSTTWAYMQETPSGYINGTLSFGRGTILEFVIVANDTLGNSNTSIPHLGYVGANNAPSASNLALIPEPIHSNESLTLSYDYYDADGDGETTTEIRWYKNDVLQPALNDSSIVLASYLFKGDHWNVTVRPKDWKEFGDLQAVNTTILNTLPQVTDVSLSPLHSSVHAKITPMEEDRVFILEDEGIKLDYIFFDADPTDLDQSTIYWYNNSIRQNQYTNLTTIPASKTTPGERWYAEILPSDGEGASPVIYSRNVTIESYPEIFGYGIEVQTTAEGYYTLWVNTTDVRNEIHEVDYVLTVEALNLTLARFPIVAFNGTSGLWVLENFNLLSYLGLEEDELHDIFVSLLNTPITVNVSITTIVTYASTDYTIERVLQFDFPITDEAPPRVDNAGIEWKSSNPTNITFWATLSEWGDGIKEVLLYYDIRPLGAQTKFADLPQGPIPMSFNGTHYLATVAFSPDQIYDILFQLSVSDLAGNTNTDAYPVGWSTGGIRFTPPPIDLGPFLIIGILIIAIIGILAVVAVRVFRKTELVGVDINKVVEASQQVSPEEIRSTISEHTLGIVISTFDQLHGPIPLFVEPPILKDNFDKLIELSDRAFSAVRFVADFEREIFTVFEFDFGVLTTSISYGFSLDRPEARGGAENITLNIVVHNPYGGLVTKFADVYANDVHQIHILMNKEESEKEEIANLVVKIRETITAIIVAYEELYGPVEEFEFD
ncbi:MAG: LamG-like jellyroll fold domain-containing protein [Promethearchaeota archaeon]